MPSKHTQATLAQRMVFHAWGVEYIVLILKMCSTAANMKSCNAVCRFHSSHFGINHSNKRKGIETQLKVIQSCSVIDFMTEMHLICLSPTVQWIELNRIFLIKPSFCHRTLICQTEAFCKDRLVLMNYWVNAERLQTTNCLIFCLLTFGVARIQGHSGKANTSGICLWKQTQFWYL